LKGSVITIPLTETPVCSGPIKSDDLRDVVQSAAEATSTHLNSRIDVIEWQGQYTLVNSSLTPHQAMIDDLFFVRGVLDQVEVRYLLVRGNDERPVIAIDWRDRGAWGEALTAACATEPFYIEAIDDPQSGAQLVADRTVSQSRSFRLFRPRVEPHGGLVYGASTGVQIELWSLHDDQIVLPVDNALTRRAFRDDEAVRGEVERYGTRWPTIENMFADHVNDIDFDIDIVFSWVDGNDVDYQRERATRMLGCVVGEGDDSPARFRHIEELRYALRSVYMFAPWVRRIFVVTDSSAPRWLAEHPRVLLVRSVDFFQDPSVLPTHNSQAIESQIHRIDGLSEHFLYSNDDMFFGRPVRPELYFSPGGVTSFIESPTRIGIGDNCVERSGFENAARVNRRLLNERFGRIITRHLEHVAVPLRRSVLFELEREFAAEFAATAASPFRESTNISVTNSLYHYYALLTGRAVIQRNARVVYVDTTTRAGLVEMDQLLAERSVDLFCLNDGSFPEIDLSLRARAVSQFLGKYFPFPAPWEKQEGDDVSNS